MEKSIIYFEEPGPENTEKLLAAARERARELGIKDVVVDTSHGVTALRALDFFEQLGLNLVAVTICEGYESEG